MTGGARFRYLEVVFKLIPVAIRYRRDRREIFRHEGRLVSPEKYKRHAELAVKSFIELGPAFIKLGQLLSVRPDVLPQPYMDEFAKLQDDVPPAPFSEVKPILEEELGPIEQIFDSFDVNAVMGASLGQVYRAKLKGNEVVVKVNRPHVREQLIVDTAVIKGLLPLIGRFIDRGLMLIGNSIIDQFAETVMEEIDYEKERSNLNIIKKNLRQSGVLIPKCYEKYSTKRVLTLEYIGGIKISDINTLDSLKINRTDLARKITKMYTKMMLTDEIFHADPHPGNLSVTNDSKIILYDFGMIGKLDKETRERLVRLYGAIARGDIDRIMDALLNLGVLQPSANKYVIKRGIELALLDMQGKKIQEADVQDLMQVANRTIYQFPFKLPRNLVLYIRTISILDGITKVLDEKFNFITYLGSVLREEGLMKDLYLDELKYSIDRIRKAIDASIDLPPMLTEFLELNQRVEIPKNRSIKFLWGLIAGISLSGLFVSMLYIPKPAGDIIFGIALVILIIVLFLQLRP